MLLCRVVENFFNVNSSEITAECLKMFGVSELAEVVATRKDRFIKKYMSNSIIAVSSARYVLFVVKFFSLSHFSCNHVISCATDFR